MTAPRFTPPAYSPPATRRRQCRSACHRQRASRCRACASWRRRPASGGRRHHTGIRGVLVFHAGQPRPAGQGHRCTDRQREVLGLHRGRLEHRVHGHGDGHVGRNDQDVLQRAGQSRQHRRHPGVLNRIRRPAERLFSGAVQPFQGGRLTRSLPRGGPRVRRASALRCRGGYRRGPAVPCG